MVLMHQNILSSAFDRLSLVGHSKVNILAQKTRVSNNFNAHFYGNKRSESFQKYLVQLKVSIFASLHQKILAPFKFASNDADARSIIHLQSPSLELPFQKFKNKVCNKVGKVMQCVQLFCLRQIRLTQSQQFPYLPELDALRFIILLNFDKNRSSS